MNAIVFSFTRNGAKISLKLQKYLDSCGFATEIFTTRRYRDLDPALKEIGPPQYCSLYPQQNQRPGGDFHR